MTDRLIRSAEPTDLAGIRAILAANDNDGPIGPFDIVGPYVSHFIDHAIAFVTELDGTVVAYGAAIDTGLARHLADFFVRPDLTGGGIGHQLLDAVLGTATRRTTFASDDPRAISLYVRAGMTPSWPLLSVEGPVARLDMAAPALETEAADPPRLAALELAWTGADRSVDHRFWASQADSDAFVVLDRGEPVGLAIARGRQASDARALDRMVVRPNTEPIAPILAALRRAGRAGVVSVSIPGPSPVLPILLGAGFRIRDRNQFLATDPELIDPSRFLPNPGML